MGFWGIEVKPGETYPYHSDNVAGVLHVTQATLGDGSAKERSVVKCSIGRESPIFVCALLPGKTESCLLNLEFGEDQLVAFSVSGSRNIHLSGFFVEHELDLSEEEDDDADFNKSDIYGEDMSDSESDSLDFNTSDEYADEFSDDEDIEEDDFELASPVRKSSVVIEEIEDDKKPVKEKGQSKKQKKKKSQSGSKDSTSTDKQIVVRGESGVRILESEDEDGFPISTKKASDSNVQSPKEDSKSTDEKSANSKMNKKTQASDVASNLKRKVENTGEEGRQEKKKKKNKKLKEQGGNENESNVEKVEKKSDEKSVDVETTQVIGQSQPEEEKKNKKNKKNGKEITEQTQTNPEQTVTATAEKKKKTSETTAEKEKANAKSSKVRTYPNGLVVEELLMGKPDGKRATRGKSVSVRYIGKLVKNGKIFDSNIGKAPFKFRLGTGQVIPGWDVGVDGMCVGDKRRITIPPEMGYGSKGAGNGRIPGNAWLTFDVELINVN